MTTEDKIREFLQDIRTLESNAHMLKDHGVSIKSEERYGYMIALSDVIEEIKKRFNLE